MYHQIFMKYYKILIKFSSHPRFFFMWFENIVISNYNRCNLLKFIKIFSSRTCSDASIVYVATNKILSLSTWVQLGRLRKKFQPNRHWWIGNILNCHQPSNFQNQWFDWKFEPFLTWLIGQVSFGCVVYKTLNYFTIYHYVCLQICWQNIILFSY